MKRVQVTPCAVNGGSKSSARRELPPASRRKRREQKNIRVPARPKLADPLTEPGWIVRISDDDHYPIATTPAMTLAQAIDQVRGWVLSGAGEVALYPPSRKGGRV